MKIKNFEQQQKGKKTLPQPTKPNHQQKKSNLQPKNNSSCDCFLEEAKIKAYYKND